MKTFPNLIKDKLIRQLAQTQTQTSSQSNSINPIIIIFFVFFLLFIIISLYIICELRTILGKNLSEEYRNKIWIFIYLSNNGFFFTSITYSPMVNDLSIGYLTLVASCLIFIVGTILFIKSIITKTGGKCMENFIIFEILKDYFKIPCDYVWKFIALTDPCCIITKYEVYQNSDGTISSNKDCVDCWNMTTYLLKRFVLILSTIIYYIFLIYLFLFFLIIKFIYWVVIQINKCCQTSCKKNNNGTSNTNININNYINSNSQTIQNAQNTGNIVFYHNTGNNQLNNNAIISNNNGNNENINIGQNGQNVKNIVDFPISQEIENIHKDNEINQNNDTQINEEPNKKNNDDNRGVNLVLKDGTDISTNRQLPSANNNDITPIKVEVNKNEHD